MSLLSDLGTKIGVKLKELKDLINTKQDKDSPIGSAWLNEAVDKRDMKPNTSGIGSGRKAMRAFFSTGGGMNSTANTDYKDVLVLDTYSDLSGGLANALVLDKHAKEIDHYQASQDASVWGTPRRLAYTDSKVSDSDKLDGLESSQFVRSDVSTTMENSRFMINNTAGSSITHNTVQNGIEVFQGTSGADATMAFHVGGDYAVHFGLDGGTNKLSVGGWSLGTNSYAIYHEGNKPTLSELGALGATAKAVDADKLDGQDSSKFMLVRGVLGPNDTTPGTTTNWPMNPAAGTYTTNYPGNSGTVLMSNDVGGSASSIAIEATYYGDLFYHSNTDSNRWQSYQIWTSASDGSGSGLDADKLDGKHASEFFQGTKTISTSAPSGGSHGDVWYQV